MKDFLFARFIIHIICNYLQLFAINVVVLTIFILFYFHRRKDWESGCLVGKLKPHQRALVGHIRV